MPIEHLVLTAEQYDRKSKIMKWVRIFVFESSASLLLVYGIMCSQYQTSPTLPPPDNFKPQLNPGHSGFSSVCLFLVLCMCGQLTGGFSNPAIAVSLMIARDNKITVKIGLAYILADYLGAFVGAGLVYLLIPFYTCPDPSSSQYLIVLGGQIFGTFLICLVSLIVINRQTTYIDSIFWSYIIIPVAYLIARQATGQIDGLNPSVVLVQQVFVGIKQNKWSPLATYWIYLVGPLIGAFLAGIFFNFFYFPFVMRWKAFNEKFHRAVQIVSSP